jgi:hypothetical protein
MSLYHFTIIVDRESDWYEDLRPNDADFWKVYGGYKVLVQVDFDYHYTPASRRGHPDRWTPEESVLDVNSVKLVDVHLPGDLRKAIQQEADTRMDGTEADALVEWVRGGGDG